MMRKVYLLAASMAALSLAACGSADHDMDAGHDHADDVPEDSVFLDKSTLDKARAVEGIQMEQKDRVDQSVDEAGR